MIKDIESNLQGQLALTAAISSDTTTNGAIIDTANFELGIVFFAFINDFTDGSYEIQIFESDDDGMSGAEQVVAPNILPTNLGANVLTLAAADSEGDVLSKIGCFSTKRYLQIRVVSTGTTSGATLQVVAAKAAELVPTT